MINDNNKECLDTNSDHNMIISADNGLKLEGFVDIEIINKRDHLTRHYHNTVTNAGKLFFLDKAAQQLLNMSTNLFGNMLCSDTLTSKGYSNINSSSGAVYGRVSSDNKDITNVLLNLGDDVTINENTTYLNILDDQYNIDNTKIVGYANNNIAARPDGKEGTITYAKEEFVVDSNTVSRRWLYPEGVASGKIDTLAMMPAQTVKSQYGDGIRLMKCIDKINLQDSTYSASSTLFVPPGIAGYTANNEIYLNFNCNSGSKWKYNIDTGTMTLVPDSEKVLNLDSNIKNIIDYFVEDNYYYVLTSASASAQTLYMYGYDLTTGEQVVYTSFSSGGGSSVRLSKASFLKYNDNVYVTVAYAYGQSKFDCIAQLTKNNQVYYNRITNAKRNYDDIIPDLPTGLNDSNICFGNYGDQYVMYVAIGSIDGLTTDVGFAGYKCKAYVFNELDNLDPSSAVDCIEGLNPSSVLFSAGTKKGVIQLGFNKESSYANQLNPSYEIYDGFDAIGRVNNLSGTKDINMNRDSVFISLDKWWTNVISFVRLQTPITKGDDDIMYVSYGYKII